MDDELMRDEQQAVREHLATCADCASEEKSLTLASRRIHPPLAREVLDGIAGDQVEQRERKQRHADERRNDQCDAL